MSQTDEVLALLRETCREYARVPRAIFQAGIAPNWPLIANSEDELEEALAKRGHFVPLPKEPAALANVIEVWIVDMLFARLQAVKDVELVRGTERAYPDIELSGSRFGDKRFAVDVKVAKRAKSGKQTQSRITLYTGNTYFRYPQLPWPGICRPFELYSAHLDVIILYTFDNKDLSRISNLEIIVHEAWRIASKQRSSTTREYIGAVQSIESLREGKGDFESIDEFYSFWRKYPFEIGRAVQQQLDKLLKSSRLGD